MRVNADLVVDGNVTAPNVQPWPIAVGDLPAGLFLALFYDQTLNNAAWNALGSVALRMGVIRVDGPSGATYIPFFANGGGGVAYKWTILDPDTGWVVNWNGTYSFVDPGTPPNTYSIDLNGGTGQLSILRSAGTSQFRVRVYLTAA